MQIFNRYEYNPQTDITGRGEFSRVYKAVDTSNQQTVAVKIYKINDLSDHYRAIQNAQMIQTFSHQGLCEYFDIEETEKEDSFGEKEKLQVCVSSFMNAGNIADYYKKHHQTELLKKLLQNVLNGLSYLHKKEIIHGYIKPSNILVTEINNEPVAKITDYAMGIFVSQPAAGNTIHPLLSLVGYLSPEQLNAHKYGMKGKVSFNSDLWSLGVVLYETLTGEPLFKISNTDFAETVAARIDAFELPEKVDTLPALFAAFLQCCLVKDASQRVQTADELLQLLFPEQATATENILKLEEDTAPLFLSATSAPLITTFANKICSG